MRSQAISLNTRPSFRIALLVLAFIGISVAGCAYYWSSLRNSQAQELRAARERIEVRANQLQEAAAQQFDATVRSIDTALKYLRIVYVDDRGNFDRAAHDVLRTYPEGMLQFVTVFGPDGYLAYASNNQRERIYFGDREHFRVHLDDKQDKLFISKPIIGRIAGVPLIQFTRAIRDGRRFLGVVGIPVRADYLAKAFGALRVAPDDLLALIRPGGGFMARNRGLEGALSATVPADRPFLLAKPGERGLFRDVATIERVPMVFSWRRLAEWPVSVVAAVNEQSELNALTLRHENERRRALQAMTTIVLLSLGAGLLLLGLARKNEQLARGEARYARVLDGTGEGFWEWNLRTQLFTVSPNFELMLGRGPGEWDASYASWLRDVHPDDVAAARTSLEAHLAGEAPAYAAEFRMRTKSGEWKWIQSRGKVAERSADGRPLLISGTHADINERRCAEAQLRKLSRAVEQSPATIVITDREGRMEYVNPRFEETTGYTRGEAIGRNPRLLKSGVNAPRVYADLWKAISAGGEWRGELCNRRKNGELYWEQAAISGLQGDDGQITHYVAVKEDITERKRAEQELARESQRSTLLLRNASDGVHILDRDGNALEVSDSFCDMLGYAREELIGANVALWDAQRSAPELKQRLDAQVNSAERAVFETRHRRRDGSVFDVEVTRQRIELDGKIVLYNSSRDVTERKRTDLALRASEEKFAKAFRSSPMFISISTVADGRYVEVNEGFLQGTGRGREEVIGRTSADIALWNDPRDRRRAIDTLLRDGRLSGFEAELCRKSGELMVCEIWAEPIEIEDSPCVIWVTNDVSARKKAEAAREQLALQLRESQKMEAIGTLAGGIAHDFNNLLAVILGNIALARQDAAPDSELARSVQEIEKAAQRAKGLVRQILAFSRRQAHELTNQALRPITEEAIRLLRATLPAGVELVTALADEPIHARCDANQVEQVLMNLCTNAWQALAGQPGRIEIRLERLALDASAAQGLGDLEPGEFAQLTVTDNGAGMDEAVRARMFEPFYTTKEPGQGTGLGLAVVHSIVKAHKGAIEVRSAPGKGTAIAVYLPLDAAPADAMQAAPESALVQGNGKRVLYLDDEEAMVMLVQRMLNRQGYRTSGYQSAQEALDAVRAAPDAFDLVVSDLNMPGLSGLDVARELRRIRPDLPVVITSGYITEEVREKALQEGVRQVVYKPNTVDELCQSIHQLLTAQAGRK